MRTLRLIAWLVCGVYATIPAYWMMVHPFAARWRTARYKLRLLGPLWMAMWCVAWALSYRWREQTLYGNAKTWFVSVPLLAVSALIYVNAGRGLSLTRVIGQTELEPERHPNSLVTSGIHSLVRHPMYLGHVTTLLAFAIGAGTLACYALFGFLLLTGSAMVTYEERELHARFGEAWERYRNRTPAILPLPGRPTSTD